MSSLHASARWLAALGAVSAALAVGAGAFGAHSLREILPPDRLAVFETGARYHLVHSVGLVAMAWVADRRGGALPVVGGALMALGVLLFSGSLYLLAISGERALGVVTPIGGGCFIAAWLITGLAVVVAPSPSRSPSTRRAVSSSPSSVPSSARGA